MYRSIAICDKCKKEHVSEASYDKSDWLKLTLRSNRSQYSEAEYLLCPECAEKLGIEKKVNEKKVVSIGDDLLEILYQMDKKPYNSNPPIIERHDR